MQITDWLVSAQEDARKRQLPELVPLLEGLSLSTTALRDADDAQRMLADARRLAEPPRP